MSSTVPGKAVRQGVYGITVQRAAGNLPATTNGNLFQVSGGRILLTTIVGEVTTAIQAQANAVKLNHQSAVLGGAGTDLCASVESSGLAVGTQFGITGTPSTAALVGAAVTQPNELVLTAGFIRLNTAATNTGAMRWTVTYVPLDDGASVQAV
jgi:hypothetical protein